MTTGLALDIGGSWARLYRFEKGVVRSVERLALSGDGASRVKAVATLVGSVPGVGAALPTACAGIKDEKRTEVVTSHFSTPLPQLCAKVLELTGVCLSPLLDDDVCAGWGHLCSPVGGLTQSSPNTLLLTGGTGVAENLWVQGTFLRKGSYPNCFELGLEGSLRAEAWRASGTAVDALRSLLEQRRCYDIERVVLSGRLAELPQLDSSELSQALGCVTELVSLPEAPALGALACSMQ